MTRQFFAAAFISYILLQSTTTYAQTTKLEGTSIYFTLPNAKWKLTISNKNGRGAIYVYQRESMDGDDTKPAISFITEDLLEQKRLSQFTHEKMSLAKITQTHYYDFREPKKIGLVNAMVSKGYTNGDSLYFGSVINGMKAVIVMCASKGKSFGKYDAEFSSFLASLSYSPSSGTKDNIAKTDNTADASRTKTVATEKGSIDACSYFPVVNGMKFTYKRNDMAGEHKIVESYNVVKDKTLKSGKTIKGYKISTTIANRNNSIIYYYCDNGSVKMYSEMPSYNTHIKTYVEDYSLFPSDYNKPDYQKTPIWETEKYGSGKYLHFTELKAGNIGTEWTDIQVVNDNPVIISSKIVEVGLTLTVQGKSYSPVIRVERTVTIKFQGTDKKLNAQEIYYAKGVGKIKVVEKGNDILMGSFTTTQELVSHNLPASQ